MIIIYTIINMQKGRSYSTDKWDSYEKNGYSFVEQGFQHEKIFVFKGKFQNQNSGMQIKQSIAEKTQGLLGTGQVKIWCNLGENRSFFSKITSNSLLFLQFDNGKRKLKSLKNNIYLGLQTNRNFNEKVGHVGIQFFEDQSWSINNKINYDFISGDHSFDIKGSLIYKNINFNGFTNITKKNTLAFNRTCLMLSFLSAKDSVYRDNWFFRLERKNKQTGSIKNVFDNAIINWMREINDCQTVGIQAKFDTRFIFSMKNWHKTVDSLWLASEWRFGDTKLKAKISNQLTHAITVKNSLGQNGSYSLGFQFSEFGTKNRIKFGAQIDLNL